MLSVATVEDTVAGGCCIAGGIASCTRFVCIGAVLDS